LKLLRSALPGLAAVVLLAGCAAQGDARPQTPSPLAQGSCGAEKVGSYLGVVSNDEVLAKIKSASGAQTLRVVGPHDVMTMDFREDRLTITTDDKGRIKTLRCV
jgi:uncharacterized lipoprotein YajG